MATIVLVHGAHAGGWWWGETRELLRAAGHDVHAPTLTGLGDRSHLSVPRVDLSLHVADVVSLLRCEEVTDAVLVGCSYGGMVITGVAQAVPERLAALVYVDALVPGPGEAAVDLLAPDRRELVLDLAARGETALPVGPGADPRLAPQPIRTFVEPLRTGDPPALPRSFIRFTDPLHPSIASSAGRVLAEPGWTYREMAGRHTAARDEPRAFTALLLELIG